MNQFKTFLPSFILAILLGFTVSRCHTYKTKYQTIILQDREQRIGVDYSKIDAMLKQTALQILSQEYFYDKNILDTNQIKEKLSLE